MLSDQEFIQKGIERLLEDKRVSFPRFYFVSNDELLKILANSRDLVEIEKNLNKCFDNVTRYQYKDAVIDALYSNEGEELKIKQVKTGSNKAGPEVWMEEIREKMTAAVKTAIRDAGKDYGPTATGDPMSRKDWVLKHTTPTAPGSAGIGQAIAA